MSLKVFDVFAGAGGFSCGFEMAGYDIIGAIEKDKWAADTFSYNHSYAKVLVNNIEAYDNHFLHETIERPDIIIGGPPCQGFSICCKNAGDPKDPRNSLFREFLRMGEIFNPHVLIMENVPNIINAKTQKGEKVINIITDEFNKLGYYTYQKVLLASDYGVPQLRRRFFLIASRFPLEQPFPSPTHYVNSSLISINLKCCPNLWDAISDLPDINAREGAEVMDYTLPPQNEYQKLCRENSSHVYNHIAMKHSQRLIERFSKMTWGQSISDICDERLKQRKRNGNGMISDKPYDQNNRRMYPHRPCNTIPATFYANFVHPYKDRNFTAREGARIQSFPDNYRFFGKPTVVSQKLLLREGRIGEAYLCQYNQIGNAVPPLMAKAIAQNIQRQWRNK